MKLSLALQTVVPWGRSCEEYVRMFDLSPGDLGVRTLDCGGGPASFTAEMSARGHRVVACDPLYRFTSEEIAARIEETYAVMVDGMEAERERFVWTYAGSPAQLGAKRMTAMRHFLADFDEGREQGRYVVAALPALPFDAGAFDLALSSHFLFLYSEQFSTGFHVASIQEMLRVARQARIFPLLDMSGQPSAHLQPVLEELERQGHEPRIKKVAYEFQRGGDQLLLVDRGKEHDRGHRHRQSVTRQA